MVAGRSPDNELYIKSKFVSRHHAQFITDEQGCTVQDLNSTNGLFIDETTNQVMPSAGRRCDQPRRA